MTSLVAHALRGTYHSSKLASNKPVSIQRIAVRAGGLVLVPDTEVVTGNAVAEVRSGPGEGVTVTSARGHALRC